MSYRGKDIEIHSIIPVESWQRAKVLTLGRFGGHAFWFAENPNPPFLPIVIKGDLSPVLNAELVRLSELCR